MRRSTEDAIETFVNRKLPDLINGLTTLNDNLTRLNDNHAALLKLQGGIDYTPLSQMVKQKDATAQPMLARISGNELHLFCSDSDSTITMDHVWKIKNTFVLQWLQGMIQ